MALEDKKIILFGAGLVGRRALNFYGADEIFCFADNRKAGQEFCGKKIISLDELKEIHADYDVIVAIGPAFSGEVLEQCASNGIAARNWADVTSYEDYESNPEIAKYKDKHKGQRCFLIGNGPSLRAEDLDKLYERHEISFGCNHIDKVYPQTKWRPKYYVAGDAALFPAYVDGFFRIGAETYFFPALEDTCSEGAAEIKARVDNIPGDVCYFKLLASGCGEMSERFSPDASRAIMSGGVTVMFSMLQLAAYMGFNAIYLLGVDCTVFPAVNPGYYSEKRHFFDENPADREVYKLDILQPDPETYLRLALNGYRAAEDYSRENGFRIYNAGRGGKLEVFERVNFDSLF